MSDFTREAKFRFGSAMMVVRKNGSCCDFGLVGQGNTKASIRLSPEEVQYIARAFLDCVQEMMETGAIETSAIPKEDAPKILLPT